MSMIRSFSKSCASHPAAGILLIAAVMTLIIAGAAKARYGSFRAALAAAGGKSLIVDEPSKSLGEMEAGRGYEATFKLTNLARHPVEVLGSRSSCSCTVTSNQFPMILKPLETRAINIIARGESGSPQFRQSIVLRTNLPGQPEIGLILSGHVKAGSPAGLQGSGLESHPEERRSAGLLASN
jgi:hypothetical protein